LRHAAKGVIHDPVQSGEKWNDFLSSPGLVIAKSFFGGSDCHLDQEIPLNRRLAKVQAHLCFDRDGFKKLIRQKNLFTLQLKQPTRQSELNSRWMHILASFTIVGAVDDRASRIIF